MSTTTSPVSLGREATTSELDEKRRHKSRKRTRSRWLKRAGLGLLALAALAWVVQAWIPRPVPVEVAQVRAMELETFVVEEGRTRVRDRFVVLAPASGVLSRVALEPGASVKAGTPVAFIRSPDPALLDPRSRADLEARLAGARAREQQAVSALERAREAHALASREASRARRLDNTIADAERDRILAGERLAASDLAAAEQGLAVAAADARAVAAGLGRAPAGKLEDVVVLAPSDGRVLRVLRESEGPVVAGTPLLELGDLAAIEVVMDVLSSDAVAITPGAAAIIEEWGGAPLRGRVVNTEPSAFTKVSALGVEEQRVNVVVAVDDPPASLGDGYRVEARVSTWRGEDTLAVPASAVFRDGEEWATYVMQGPRVHLRKIQLGHRGRLFVEVTGGVSAGDRVVLYPGERVQDGARVEVR